MKPWLKPLAAGGVAALLVLAGYAGGRWQLEQQPDETATASDGAGPLDNPELLLADSDRQICEARAQSCEVARAELRQSIIELTAGRTELLEELEFYRGLVAPDNTDLGPRVHKAEWHELTPDRGLLRLVLVRHNPGKKLSEGLMVIRLRGEQDGQAQEWPIGDLLLAEGTTQAYRFRYFFEWEAEVQLPEGFSPERLLVTLHGRGRLAPVVESVMWSEMEKIDVR